MERIIIVGAGPSGLFAAKTILENSEDFSVTLFERGRPPDKRCCRSNCGSCCYCEVCDVLQGAGGAGLFSDGKLVLDLSSGGRAKGVSSLSDRRKEVITQNIRETFEKFDGVSERKSKPDLQNQESIRNLFDTQNLSIKFYDVLHMGTNNLTSISKNFISYLQEKYPSRFSIQYETAVVNVTERGDRYAVSTVSEDCLADAVILAVGKNGASWLKDILSPKGCTFEQNNYFFGVRLEMKSSAIRRLIDFSLDPKVFRIDNGRKVKLHCVCRKGKICFSNYEGSVIVGGHSPYTQYNQNPTDIENANFNVLLSFDKNIVSSKQILTAFKTIAPNQIVAQKLGDFIRNSETDEWGNIVPKEATLPANIRKVMDALDVQFAVIFIRFLQSLSKICPDVLNDDNLIYAPAIEWDMDTIRVNEYMETDIKNIFAIGDGAGLSQGIVYSAATGIIAAERLISNYYEEKHG